MAPNLDDALRDRLYRFVNERMDAIRNCDRDSLDSTYSAQCLQRRNQYNQHDFDWYLNLIEAGFGAAIQRIDIEVVNRSILPFAGMVTYPWQPQYKVYVQTITRRRTLWLVRVFEDGPKVVLPGFNGEIADRVATGEWQLPTPTEERSDCTTIIEFHAEHFTVAVVESLASMLQTWYLRLKFETIRAVALSCAPWFGTCHLAMLTTQEDFSDQDIGKWAIGDWRWGEMEEISFESLQLLSKYYSGQTATDTQLTAEQRADVIFQCLARALKSPLLQDRLGFFRRSNDFELGVIDPDHPSRGNYCDLL